MMRPGGKWSSWISRSRAGKTPPGLPVLHYSTRPQRRIVLWCVIACVIALLVAAGYVYLGGITVYTESRDICVVCGSHQGHTRWLDTFNVRTAQTPSALERWMLRMGMQHQHTWQALATAGRNVYGQVVWRGCNRAPPVYAIAFTDVERYASDEQLRALLETMRTGTQDQQEQAIHDLLKAR